MSTGIAYLPSSTGTYQRDKLSDRLIDVSKLFISFCRFLVSFLIVDTNIKPRINKIMVKEYFVIDLFLFGWGVVLTNLFESFVSYFS